MRNDAKTKKRFGWHFTKKRKMGIHKIWKSGTSTLVITIDKTTQTALELTEGDFIEIQTIKKITPKKEVSKDKEQDTETNKKKAIFK